MVEPDEAQRLAALAQRVHPSHRIVELGTHTGLSTLWLASNARAHIVAIDPWGDPRPGSEDDPLGLGAGDNVLETYRANVRAAGALDRITALRATSTEVARIWTHPVGLLFVDAVHSHEAVLEDVQAFRPYLPPGAWVAFHDYTTDPEHPYFGVSQAVAELGPWRSPSLVGHLWAGRVV